MNATQFDLDRLNGGNLDAIAVSYGAVPEPFSMTLLGTGLVGLAVGRCRGR